MKIFFRACIMLALVGASFSLGACKGESNNSASSSQSSLQKEKIYLTVYYDSKRFEAAQQEIQRALDSRGVNYKWVDYATLKLPQGSYGYLKRIKGVKQVEKSPY